MCARAQLRGGNGTGARPAVLRLTARRPMAWEDTCQWGSRAVRRSLRPWDGAPTRALRLLGSTRRDSMRSRASDAASARESSGSRLAADTPAHSSGAAPERFETLLSEEP